MCFLALRFRHMNHFDETQWVDFVRGVKPRAMRTAMTVHLQTGCPRCQHIERVLRNIAAAAKAEPGYQPPERAVRNVRAIYALQRPEKFSSFRRVVGRLLYDSFREPLPAGLRSRQFLARQVLYQAENYSLDLRLEHQRGGRVVTLVGQIADQREPNRPLQNLPVFLLSGKDLVAHAFSNDYGEFQLEYEPRRSLRLLIQAHQGARNRIEVNLSRIAARSNEERNLSRRADKTRN